MSWKNITINKQNIKGETEKAVLIAMPHNSRFDGFSFWHPKKLVREGCNSYAREIGYTDEWKFNLVKYGNGKYNKYDTIDSEQIDSQEFEIAFGVMSENLNPKQRVNKYETHKPSAIEPLAHNEVLRELKDE